MSRMASMVRIRKAIVEMDLLNKVRSITVVTISTAQSISRSVLAIFESMLVSLDFNVTIGWKIVKL